MKIIFIYKLMLRSYLVVGLLTHYLQTNDLIFQYIIKRTSKMLFYATCVVD